MRAKLLANWAATEIDNLAQAMVFKDGVIVYLAVSDETLTRITQRLGGRLQEHARSDDGRIVALLITPDSLEHIDSEVEIEWTDEHEETEIGEFVRGISEID